MLENQTLILQEPVDFKILTNDRKTQKIYQKVNKLKH